MRIAFSLSLFATIAIPATAGAQSPEFTQWGHVTALETGHSIDSVSVWLDSSVPLVNGLTWHLPTGMGEGVWSPCGTTNAGYALDPVDPGIKVHESALLTAFASRKWTRLLIEGCVFDKPKIIGVGLAEEHP